mmetsp:Transcript_29458/g.63406  ORF Transcript_29458/g.63406 Transcript_29458/m.63406 type:complete len:274 (-) Transcript_29458:318-1139(-)
MPSATLPSRAPLHHARRVPRRPINSFSSCISPSTARPLPNGSTVRVLPWLASRHCASVMCSELVSALFSSAARVATSSPGRAIHPSTPSGAWLCPCPSLLLPSAPGAPGGSRCCILHATSRSSSTMSFALPPGRDLRRSHRAPASSARLPPVRILSRLCVGSCSSRRSASPPAKRPITLAIRHATSCLPSPACSRFPSRIAMRLRDGLRRLTRVGGGPLCPMLTRPRSRPIVSLIFSGAFSSDCSSSCRGDGLRPVRSRCGAVGTLCATPCPV